MSGRRKVMDATARAESLIADIESLPTASKGRGLRVPERIIFDMAAYSAVLQAARDRRLSVDSFIRRSALAMAAFDLDIPVVDLLQRDPRIQRENGAVMKDANGTRFGSWDIESLREVKRGA